MRIAIEGNIGSGKSELLRGLARLGYQVRQEPVEAWTLLQSFYRDQAKFAFALQAQILASYSDACEQIQERSARSGLQVFAKMLAEDGKLNEAEMETLFRLYTQLPLEKVDLIVYLDISPETCLQRIKTRGRECEEGMPLEYLRRVETSYHAYFRGCEEEGVKVVRISGANSIEDVLNNVAACIHTL